MAKAAGTTLTDSSRPVLVRGGRLLDPSTGFDGVVDLLVEDGTVSCAVPPGEAPVDEPSIVEAEGMWIFPGLVDMHVHLREPGADASETVASGLRAAIAGGFTKVAAMPNTDPPTDTPERVAEMAARGRLAGAAELLVVGCVTRGRAGGVIADIEGMARAGATAFSDDGSPVLDPALLAEAMAASEAAGGVLIQHAELTGLSRGGVVNLGPVSRELGLEGIPGSSETGAVALTLEAARACGCRVHLTHLSLPGSVDLVRAAVEGGVAATCDVTPHHLALDETEVLRSGACAKMNPPLRSARDREELVERVRAGRVPAVASDHAPHEARLKAAGLAGAPFGITGLETALPVTFGALGDGMSPLRKLSLFTTGPCSILRIACPSLAPGRPFDAVLYDPCEEWTPSRDNTFSASTNTPFLGRTLRGRVRAVWRGRLVYHDGCFVS